ncbi:MAG: hypothetical protein COC01_04020 [Bacteroidetes bacterium]|nr:MAG: hypothetical protein COC01_04020 [Bacteroidota bacterium]
MKRFLTAVVALLLVTSFSFAGGPFDGMMKDGKIEKIERENGKRVATVIVIENQTRQNYTVLLKPKEMPRAVYSNVGDRIIFNLFTGVGGLGGPYDGIEME